MSLLSFGVLWWNANITCQFDNDDFVNVNVNVALFEKISLDLQNKKSKMWVSFWTYLERLIKRVSLM